MLEIEPLLSADPSTDSSRLIQRSEKALAAALLSGSARPVRAAISFLKLKYHVTYQQLRPIAELLWAIFLKVGGNVYEETDVAISLSFVLKLLNKLPDCPAHGTSERFTLPWRPLSDALLKVQMHGISAEEWSVGGPTEIPIGAETVKMHGQALTGLIRRARNFFTPDAAREIVKHFSPYLCPHEAGLYRAVGLICLMTPEYVDESFITDACSLWHSIPNCLEWSYLWTHLFSRLVRHNNSLVVPALQSHLPQIFESLLFLLEIPSSKDSAQRPELLTWPPDCSFLVNKTSLKNEIVKKMTRLIVYSLGPHSSTWDFLKNLVLYLQPFFHPLNEGAWTSSLDMFLKMLTLNYAKRVGIERGAHRAKRPWLTVSPFTVDEEIDFVQLMLPLALTAFESKDYYMSFGAAQALKDLVSLQPDTALPLVTDRLIPALENSMKPHEALNSMEVFSVILGPLLRSPDGIEHAIIAQMLQQTVLGIDNNDPMKTLKTLRLYMRFVTLTPLLHPTDVPATKPEWVYILPEWTITVIDRLWSFLCNIPAIKKGSGLDYVLSRNVIRHFLDTFFQQMSPSLYTAALKHVCQKVSSTYYPPAKKYFGQFLDACVFTDGEEALMVLVPLIVSKFMDKGGSSLLGNGSETAYWVHLLGHIVARSGEHILPLLQTVTSVLDSVVMHDDKDLRKQGHKLLRKVLRSFLTIRPADFRSLPADEWNFKKCGKVSQLVHPDIVPPLSAVKFVYPSDTSQRQAQVLVEKYFASVEKKLVSTDTVVPPTTLRACFGCLEALVRGASALFPDDEAPVFEALLSEADLESEMDESEGNVGLCLGMGVGKTDWGKKFRDSLSALLNKLCKVYSVRENPDVVSVKALLRVVQFFLSEKGYKSPDHDQVNYNKAVYRLWNQGMPGTYTRNMLIQKAYALLTRRMAAGVWAISTLSQPLLENLVSMSMHEYSVVRKKAQKAIPKILVRYPGFSNYIVSSVLDVFRVDKSSKAVVNGAIYTINTAVMLKQTARQWKHTASMINGLMMSHHFADMKVQVRLAELWKAFVPYTGRLGFVSAVPIGEEVILDGVIRGHFSSAQAQAAVLEGANLRRAVRASQEAIYDKVIENIMKTLGESGKLHWRFALLAASSLSILLRSEKSPTPEMLQFFLTGLSSEILPLRQLCRVMFPTIMRFSNKATSMEVCNESDSAMDTDMTTLTFKDLDLPLSEQYWDGPSIDGLWRGWDGSLDMSQNVLFNNNSAYVHEAVQEWLQCKDKVDRFCELLASDHRLSGDERASDNDTSAIAGMPLPSAAVLSLFETSWHWPRTSAASFSTAISKPNIFVIETIIKSGGLTGLNALWAQLETNIVKQGDREAQCLAAELLAGVVRGTAGSSTAADRKEIDSRLEKLVASALVHIPLESTGEWMEAIRLCVCNRDPRRFQWMSRAVANLSSNVESSTSTALNGLKLKQALLIEFGWRGYSFAKAISDQLFSLLSGSSKSVREEAARCLVLVAQIDACLPASSVSIRPRLGVELSCSREVLCQRFPSIFRRLIEAYNSTASGGNTCPKLLKEEVEGVLYYFIHASRLGKTSSAGPFVSEAMGLLLAVHEDGDREFAQVGKISSQLVCAAADFAVLSGLLDSSASIFSVASSWRVRLGALDAIRAIAHRLVLDSNPRNRALEIFKVGLTDKVLDVRIFAHLCLAGLLRMVPSEYIMAIIAEAPKSRKRGKIQGQVTDNIEVRHGKVLGLSAAVLSHPTDLPEWMADAVTALCSLNDEDPIIKQSIINTIGEFKKTHQDLWPIILMTWSSDQLSLMSDFMGARSYYS